MVKSKFIQILVAVLMVFTASVFFSCDTTTKNHPCVIIHVSLGAATPGPLNKLYMVFHLKNDWASPWLTLSTETNTILVPPLNVGTVPLYFEIIYDFDGDGIPGGLGVDWYQGWYGKIDRLTPNLNPFLIPDVPILILNIAMDQPLVNYNTF